MKLVLKIAAGVFLGIVMAFVLYMALRTWELHREQQLEAENKEARRKDEEVRIAEAAKSLTKLTAAELVKRCGAPLEEPDSVPRDFGYTWLRYQYFGADGKILFVRFNCHPEVPLPCSYIDISRKERRFSNRSDSKDYEVSLEDNGELHYPSSEEQVRELPCLAARVEAPKR